MAICYERVQRCADPGGVSFVIISASPGADCVVVARELDLLTCPALYRRLVEQLDFGACRVLVIDFSRVGFLGAAGLGVLVEVRDRGRAWWSRAAFGGLLWAGVASVAVDRARG